MMDIISKEIHSSKIYLFYVISMIQKQFFFSNFKNLKKMTTYKNNFARISLIYFFVGKIKV